MRTCHVVSLALAIALSPLFADTVELTSGETLVGAVIGETSEALHVLTREGEERFPRDEVRSWAPSTEGVSESTRRRAAHLGQRLAKQRAGHARSWLKRASKGSEAARTKAWEAFSAFERSARLQAAQSAADDGVSLELALQVLTEAEAVDPLLQVAIGGDRREARDAAHAAAAQLDPERAREAYVSVMRDDGLSARSRYRALGHLGALADRRALRQVEALVLHLQQEVKTALAEAKASRTASVDLSGGNTALPVELPEVRLISLSSSQRMLVIKALLARAEEVQGILREAPEVGAPAEAR
ncbi:MAG: hypothetical protein KDD82_20610 [Planctomycetes bacterium]|nr:hypothetical protein [Planctomycetota bacterium]